MYPSALAIPTSCSASENDYLILIQSTDFAMKLNADASAFLTELETAQGQGMRCYQRGRIKMSDNAMN